MLSTLALALWCCIGIGILVFQAKRTIAVMLARYTPSILAGIACGAFLVGAFESLWVEPGNPQAIGAFGALENSGFLASIGLLLGLEAVILFISALFTRISATNAP